MSLSHSATGGDTRKKLELLVLGEKCSLAHLRCLSEGGKLEIDVRCWGGVPACFNVVLT